MGVFTVRAYWDPHTLDKVPQNRRSEVTVGFQRYGLRSGTPMPCLIEKSWRIFTKRGSGEKVTL